MMQIAAFSAIQSKGAPIGLRDLFPVGDRGLTFGKSQSSGILFPGKIAGFWTAPYDGVITAVYLSTDQGGYTVQFRRKRGGHSIPSEDDVISRNGYTIA